MINRVVFSPVCLAMILGCAVTQADQALVPIGGSGGGPFTARCAQGAMLTGLELSTGDDVDAIRPVCAVAYQPEQAGPAMPYPSRYGGNGGGATSQLICPDATPVITGLYVQAEGADTTIVNRVHLFCGLAEATARRGAYPGPAYDGPKEESGGIWSHFSSPFDDTAFCPAGLVAVGINGRSGIWLDAVGLVCGAPTLTEDPSRGKVLGRLKPNKPAIEVPKPTTNMSAGVSTASVSQTSTRAPAPDNVVPAGAAILYAYGSDGVLKWYRHNGAA